ncbi:DUF406 family protein [Shewanella intestini]|uniref:DUF406 family protein n=1 Tax=Shewanella intestini TaxID=2017544 RepID=A0ABS5HZP4_9GAMM|nr:MULTISPECIES: DUF406 family protein [Shewanella]MBR9727258.1 DUF406 family protein [Shewanella intestini]MRG36060.1 DUF406 family protein [Shewanella sp. XMDDZSB0408]
MVQTIKNQQANVNDSCPECGSFVDIGAVIEENDCVLTIKSTAQQKQALTDIVDKAKQRFQNVTATFTDTEHGESVDIVFDVAAEKMIFQLENQL